MLEWANQAVLCSEVTVSATPMADGLIASLMSLNPIRFYLTVIKAMRLMFVSREIRYPLIPESRDGAAADAPGHLSTSVVVVEVVQGLQLRLELLHLEAHRALQLRLLVGGQLP